MKTQENSVPGWYVFTAIVSMPDGLIRYIIKPGFSAKGEDDAADRQLSFLNALKFTTKLWGGYTDNEIKTFIKEPHHFVFINAKANDVENKILTILKESADQKPAKDISPFGTNDKGGPSKEMYQIRKDLYEQINSFLSELNDTEQQKYATILANKKALAHAIRYRETNPSVLQSTIDQISKEFDLKKSGDEDIANAFLSELKEILADRKIDDSLPATNDSSSDCALLDHLMNNEKVAVSMKNEGKFYFSYLKGTETYECVISVRASTNSVRVQTKQGQISAKNIKKLYENARLTFADPKVEGEFGAFIKDMKPYIQKHQPKSV